MKALFSTFYLLAVVAGQLDLAWFRAQTPDGQRGAVVGAMAVTDQLGITCAYPGTVGEYRAALLYRPLDVYKPWVEYLIMLMDERQCSAKSATKPDA